MNEEAEAELEPATYSAIKDLCARGDELAAEKSYREAIEQYNEAWLLVPDPKDEWTASTWILTAIGDAAFLAGFKALAEQALQDAMICPRAIGNPFIHLRLGQVLFDKGELDAAADELMRAYMSEGEEIFSSENPQYLAFLRTRANI